MTTQPRESGSEVQGSGMHVTGGAIAGLSGGGVLAIFMAQNREQVTVNFLAWEFACPVWLLALGAAVFGGLIWFGVTLVRTHRRRKERRQDRRAGRRD